MLKQTHPPHTHKTHPLVRFALGLLRIPAIHDVRPDMTHFKCNARLLIKSVACNLILSESKLKGKMHNSLLHIILLLAQKVDFLLIF